MAKITLEPGKTTWVPFLEGEADFEIERVCEIRYASNYTVLNENTYKARVRYLITGLGGGLATPPSKVTVKFQGIPVLVTSSEPTTDPEKFNTEWIEEAFVEVKDRVAKRTKGEITEKKLGKRLIERTWEETVEHTLNVENETGKRIQLELKVYDAPGNNIVLEKCDPDPDTKQSPEHIWKFELEKDEKKLITCVLTIQQKEQIELPPEKEPQEE